jgi:hypothetical protein
MYENEENKTFTQTFNFINKTDEIKFFLREYYNFEKEVSDYYYIIPFKWIILWDNYITDFTLYYILIQKF